MTADELKQRVLARIKSPAAESVVDEVLRPYIERDRKMDGTSVAPYDFDEHGVLWLEREVKRRIGK
jgi:hypothetical protein